MDDIAGNETQAREGNATNCGIYFSSKTIAKLIISLRSNYFFYGLSGRQSRHIRHIPKINLRLKSDHCVFGSHDIEVL